MRLWVSQVNGVEIKSDHVDGFSPHEERYAYDEI